MTRARSLRRALLALVGFVVLVGVATPSGQMTIRRGFGVLTAGTGSGQYYAAGQVPGTDALTTTTVGTADTNYNCIALGTIPANTLGNVGDLIEVVFESVNTAGASTRTFVANVGGTCAADATGFTGGFSFYTATNGTASLQLLHTARLLLTSAAHFKGSGGWIATNGSSTNGSTYTTGSSMTTNTLALGIAFRDGSSAVNTMISAVATFYPAAP